MADRVRYNMDRMAGLFKQLEEAELFTKDEIKAIVTKRTNYEYMMVRFSVSPKDIEEYIQYELVLDKLLEIRCKRVTAEYLDKQKMHTIREIQSAFITQVNYVFTRCFKKFPYLSGASADSIKCPRRVLYLAVEYLQAKKSYNLLDMLFGTVIAHNPSVVEVYVAAAKVEMGRRNLHAARVLLQQGLRNTQDEALWMAYVDLEVWAVLRGRERLAALDEGLSKGKSKKSKAKEQEEGEGEGEEEEEKAEVSAQLLCHDCAAGGCGECLSAGVAHEDGRLKGDRLKTPSAFGPQCFLQDPFSVPSALICPLPSSHITNPADQAPAQYEVNEDALLVVLKHACAALRPQTCMTLALSMLEVSDKAFQILDAQIPRTDSQISRSALEVYQLKVHLLRGGALTAYAGLTATGLVYMLQDPTHSNNIPRHLTTLLGTVCTSSVVDLPLADALCCVADKLTACELARELHQVSTTEEVQQLLTTQCEGLVSRTIAEWTALPPHLLRGGAVDVSLAHLLALLRRCTVTVPVHLLALLCREDASYTAEEVLKGTATAEEVLVQTALLQVAPRKIEEFLNSLFLNSTPSVVLGQIVKLTSSCIHSLRGVDLSALAAPYVQSLIRDRSQEDKQEELLKTLQLLQAKGLVGDEVIVDLLHGTGRHEEANHLQFKRRRLMVAV